MVINDEKCMNQNIQIILQEDQLFQAEKQKLQENSKEKIKARKHKLELEIATLKSELIAISKDARDQSNALSQLSDEQLKAINSQKMALKELLKKRSKVAVETITHILQNGI